MRRLVAIVGLVLLVSACGEDTPDPASFSRSPWTPPPPQPTTTTATAEPLSRWSDEGLGALCRDWEAEFMKEPAPDRRAHVDKLLRALTEEDEWQEQTVTERRQVEATAERALAGDC